jgi:hypothetical protein
MPSVKLPKKATPAKETTEAKTAEKIAENGEPKLEQAIARTGGHSRQEGRGT